MFLWSWRYINHLNAISEGNFNVVNPLVINARNYYHVSIVFCQLHCPWLCIFSNIIYLFILSWKIEMHWRNILPEMSIELTSSTWSLLSYYYSMNNFTKRSSFFWKVKKIGFSQDKLDTKCWYFSTVIIIVERQSLDGVAILHVSLLRFSTPYNYVVHCIRFFMSSKYDFLRLSNLPSNMLQIKPLCLMIWRTSFIFLDFWWS